MFQTIANAFRNPDLRKKLLFTIFIIVIFRIGSAIIVPFVDATAVSAAIGDGNNFFGLLNTFSGGAFGKATLFALSISPYITASIIVQLLTVAIPALERMAKEGETGKKKLNMITKWVTLAMAVIQAYGYYWIVYNNGGIASEYKSGATGYFVMAVIVIALTAGAFAVTWLGEQITEKGIGNGISILLFVGILAGMPESLDVLWQSFKQGGVNYVLVPLILLIFAAMIVFIVIMTDAERRIPVQYAKRVVGRKMYGGQSSYIPIKVNMTSVLPIIFASSLLNLPGMIIEFTQTTNRFWLGVYRVLSPSHWFYAILYLLLIIGFNYFYVAVQYNPIEIANNIKNNNGAIPGIRPGKPTSTFISRVLSKIVFIGALFLGVIAIFPILFNVATGMPVALGGTSIIIVVGVALETVQQLEQQLMMRHHKGFLE